MRARRLESLRQALAGAGVEGLLVYRPANRLYLSSFTGSTGVLLVTGGQNFLITDFRYWEQAVIETPDFELVKVRDGYPEGVAQAVAESGISRVGFEADVVSYQQYEAWRGKMPQGTELVPVNGLVERLRAVKDEEELRLIEAAAAITEETLARVVTGIRPGITEVELAVEIEYTMRRLGAEKPAFEFVVAAGERAALPHARPSQKTLERGDLLLLDVGAVYGGYNSDLTRMVVLGPPDPRQAEIFRQVRLAQEAGLAAIRAGVTGVQVDAVAREVIKEAGYGDHFGHGLGHGVGLEVHEGPRLSSSDQTVLERGMVVTVEPGIYLPGWGGVRVEDLVVVEQDGFRPLTRSSKDLVSL